MKNIKTNALVDVAVMTAVSAVLIFLSVWIPFFSIIGNFISGVPLAVVTVKHGVKLSALSSLVLLLILCIVLSDPLGTFSIFLLIVLPGIVSGICIKYDRDFFTSLVFVTLSVILAVLAGIQVLNIVSGDKAVVSIITQYSDIFGETLKQRLSGLDAGQLEGIDIDTSVNQIKDALFNAINIYFPTLMIIASIIVGYVSFRINIFFVRRLNVREYKKEIPFEYFRASKGMLYIIFIIYILSFCFMRGTENSLVMFVFRNMSAVINFIMLVCGLSVIDFYFKRAIQRGWIRYTIYLMVFILGGMIITILSYIILMIGMFDVFFNLRRI